MNGQALDRGQRGARQGAAEVNAGKDGVKGRGGIGSAESRPSKHHQPTPGRGLTPATIARRLAALALV
jgi:hypothetical protein